MKNTFKIKYLCILLGFASGLAQAADAYPTRPVRMIVPFAPGGPTDVIARVVAQRLSESLAQQVVVDNRAGAGGNIGMGIAANATPDGHTVLVVSSSFVVNPGLYSKIPYDPYKSFIPVTNMAASPNVFVVHPSIPAKSIGELIKLAQAAPKKYSFATPGIGTTPDLSAVLLRLTAKIDAGTVPYGGAGPAVAAVLGNQVAFGCMAMPPTIPHIQAGRLRALAVTAARRSPALPDVQTMAEAGLTGQEADTLQGVLLPAGTPRAVVQRLHGDISKILARPDVRERITGLGFDIIASSQQDFTAQIKSEIARWTKVVKDADIKVN
jgi:tripartite-type tricarboxylate transporter receptor subunit TctC